MKPFRLRAFTTLSRIVEAPLKPSLRNSIVKANTTQPRTFTSLPSSTVSALVLPVADTSCQRINQRTLHQLSSAMASAETAEIVRKGSCLCGRVHFETTGNPFTFVVCHCHNCKKSSGAAFMANAFFSPKNLKITGQEHVKEYSDSNTTSGNTLTRSFCSECGSSLFITSPTQKDDWIIVCSGTMDDTVHEWIPRRESRSDCRLDWIKDIDFRAKSKPSL